jgi:hypothetical protein
VALSTCDKALQTKPEQSAAFRQDLRALYDRLRRIFETDSANFHGPTLSNKNPS